MEHTKELILDSAKQILRCYEPADIECKIIQYTSCCNANKDVHYYTTFGNWCIAAVEMYLEALEHQELVFFLPFHDEDVRIVIPKSIQLLQAGPLAIHNGRQGLLLVGGSAPKPL